MQKLEKYAEEAETAASEAAAAQAEVKAKAAALMELSKASAKVSRNILLRNSFLVGVDSRFVYKSGTGRGGNSVGGS